MPLFFWVVRSETRRNLLGKVSITETHNCIFHPIEETQIYQPVFRQPPGKKAAYRDRSHCTIHNTDRAFFILSTKFLVTLSFRLLFAFPLPVPFFSQPSGRLPSRDKTRQGSDRILYTKWLGGESPAVSETEASRRRKGRKPWKGEKKRIERKTINNLAKR